MSQISVREGVGRGLQPYYDRMQFCKGAYEGMADVEVDEHGCDYECKSDIETVRPRNYLPRGLELASLLLRWTSAAIPAPHSRSLGLLSGGEFD